LTNGQGPAQVAAEGEVCRWSPFRVRPGIPVTRVSAVLTQRISASATSPRSPP